jgi:methylenetetrahydrofolate reductase (NADPH)
VGWGGPDGRVYQKAYLEFFAPPDLTRWLVERLARFPSISFTACNRAGKTFTNCDDTHVNAVTWGVFPRQEIIQPTVVDPVSFRIWLEEAFDLWMSEWASLYEDGSKSNEVLTTIRDTYFLVNVVDNDYVDGDIFTPFEIVAALETPSTRGG